MHASLESDDPVVLGVRSGSVNRCAEATVLPFEIALGDPTGPTAEPSNGDPNLPFVEEGDQVLEGRDAIALDLGGDAVLDERSRLAHEDHARLVAGVERALRHEERNVAPVGSSVPAVPM